MKALAVFGSQKKVAMIDHPEPEIQSPMDVKFRIERVGVCGTDREIWSFQYGEPPPGSDYLITGHEALGRAVAVGASVKRFRPGDWVVPTVRRGCPENCAACAALRPDFCYTGHYTERGIKGAHGYMAEFVVEDDRYLNRVPSELSDVAVLLEPLTITEKALIEIDLVQKRLPWTCRLALVLGAGPVGILAAMALRNRGISTVAVAHHAKPNPKADLLKKLNVDYFATAQQTPEEIVKVTGKPDLIIEATGSARVAFDFLPVLGTNGVFVLTGVPGHGRDESLDTSALMRAMVLRNQVALGTVNASPAAFSDGVRDLGDFIRKWPEALRGVITEQVPIADFSRAREENPTEIKTVLTFPSH